MGMKEIREGKKLTRQQVADAVGVNVRTVGRWETGDRAPDAEKLEKLIWCLGASAEELGLAGKKETAESQHKEMVEPQCEETENWWAEEKKEEEKPKKLLCAFRARQDRFNSSITYFPPCLRTECSAYRNGECIFKR